MDAFALRPSLRPPRTARLLALCLLGLAGLSVTAMAQPAGTAPLEREPVRTLEQKTERIVHQDAGSRIEELRIGGQTRSIEVQTNSRVPGYQVQPLDPARSQDDRGSSGKSSWRVLQF